jgi:hypothetical protein
MERKLNPKPGREKGSPAYVRNPGKRNPAARVAPRRKRNSDPENDLALRKPDGTYEEIDMTELMDFIIENYDNPEIFRDHPQKEQVLDLVDHLFAVSVGGWREEDGVYINESGRAASPTNWKLTGDKLVHRERSAILEDKDWIHDIRRVILDKE